MAETNDSRSRIRWPALFHDNTRPLFVLNRARRLRFVNTAWEKLTGEAAADVLGKACLRKGPTEPLFRALAPPPELSEKQVAVVRRPAPPQQNGPPWWDVTFVKLSEVGGGSGFLGLIDVIAPAPGQPAKTVSPHLGSLRKRHAEAYSFDLFAGASLKAELFLNRLRHASASTAPVWLQGEPGSGKETAARVIHHNSPKREQPFVAIRSAGLQPYLIEALLFGAAGLALGNRIGTLFLDHPANLPRDMQQKLSDWLLHSAAPPRLISVSLNPPQHDVAAGILRPEFASELAVLELSPLPLRERFDDLPAIVERQLASLGKSLSLSDEAEKVLRGHLWPGNLSELRDALAAVTDTSGTLQAAQLPRYLREKSLLTEIAPRTPRPSLDAMLEAVEKRLIQHTLAECGGNQTETAQRLGIHRARLIRRLDALGLAPSPPE